MNTNQNILTKEDLQEEIRRREKKFLKRFRQEVVEQDDGFQSVTWNEEYDDRYKFECNQIGTLGDLMGQFPHALVLTWSIQAIAEMRRIIRAHLSDETRLFFKENADLYRFMGLQYVF